MFRTLRATALGFALVGCSQPQPPVESAPELTSAVVVQPVDAPAAVPVAPSQPPPKPEPPPPSFTFPADNAGTAVARVVTPDVTRPLPPDKVATAPKPRTVPARVLDPNPLPVANYALAPLLPPKPVPPKPVAPAEKVPLDLGARADGVPAKPALPVSPVVTARARDADLPPAAPVLGRPLVERVGLDDPTAELGNASVVGAVVKAPPAASGFVKASVPDPFELSEQVKPKVPASAEPTAAPVVVNPQRAK